MRSRCHVAVVLAVVGCKENSKAARPPDPAKACAAALTAPAAAGSIDHGLGAVLDACTPCGVSWQPLVALSSFDPDTVPGALPGPEEVLAVLDACQATCTGTARTEIAELFRGAQAGHTPAAPWRKLADRCDGALRVDEHSLRFARGTWYALDRIAHALWADDAPPELARARSTRAYPLPPFSTASTALAVPDVEVAPSWAPRLHVTVMEDHVFAGVLPWVTLTAKGPELLPGLGADYPGDPIEPAALAARLDEHLAATAKSPYAIDAEQRVVVIAPRGLRVTRVLEVLAPLGRPVYLAGTPRTHAAPWPEPVIPVPVALVTAPAPGAATVELPATAKIADLAAALVALPAGTTAAYVTIDPLSSP